jgi:hypothetical protein
MSAKPTIMKKMVMLSCLVLTSLMGFGQRRIAGTIRVSYNGMPQAGVNVTVPGTNVSTKSDSAGKYQIIIPAGSDSLTFSGKNFETQIRYANQSNTLNIALIAIDKATVRGTVWDAFTKKPLAGATIIVDNKGIAATDINGKYSVTVNRRETLRFALIYYEAQNYALKPDQQVLDIALKELN